MRERTRLSASVLGALLLALPFAACSGGKVETRGQIMLAVQTDMSIPEDVSHVRIVVLKNGALKFDQKYRVGPNGDEIPATLGLVASDNPEDTIEVRVLSYQGATVRTLNRAVTTIPQDRIATLRVPIQWLCDAQVKPTEGIPDSYESTCPDPEQACVAGECRDVAIPEKDLPDFDRVALNGGARDPKRGVCFQTGPCLDVGYDVVPDASCRIRVPESAIERLNVGLVLPPGRGGICSTTSETCYIPLDRSDTHGFRILAGAAGGGSAEGEGGASGGDMPNEGGGGSSGGPADGPQVLVQLPPATCAKLESGAIRAVRVTTACDPKTESTPACGPWTSIGSENPELGPREDGPNAMPMMPTDPGEEPGPSPTQPTDTSCPELYEEPSSGSITTNPEVNRFISLVLALRGHVGRQQINLGAACVGINDQLGDDEPGEFVGEVPTEEELSAACTRAHGNLTLGEERARVLQSEGYCHADIQEQLAFETQCPLSAGCEVGDFEARCHDPLFDCTGSCLGECLPTSMMLGVSCDDQCTGQCSGTCTGSCVGPNGNPLPLSECRGYCSGVCTGTCEGSCAATEATTCAGICSGTCEGGVREELCRLPLEPPSCAGDSVCWPMAAVEAVLRQTCVDPYLFVTNASGELGAAVGEHLPRVLRALQESENLSLAASYLVDASTELHSSVVPTGQDAACLVEATKLLGEVAASLSNVLLNTSEILSAIEQGTPPVSGGGNACTPRSEDDACVTCIKSSCCAEYEACLGSSACVAESPCMDACLARDEAYSKCERDCSFAGDGTLSPVTSDLLGCRVELCPACGTIPVSCETVDEVNGLPLDDFEDMNFQATLGTWRLYESVDFSGSLGWPTHGDAAPSTALGVAGGPEPGLSLDLVQCVDLFGSGGLGFQLAIDGEMPPLELSVRIRTRETELPERGGDCVSPRCGDHYVTTFAHEGGFFFFDFILPWFEFRDSQGSTPDASALVGIDFIGHDFVTQFAIDDVRLVPPLTHAFVLDP